MKPTRIILPIVIALLLASIAIAESEPPAVGGRLPDIVLPVPKDAAHQAYIGVAGRDDFRIPDVKARLVIIEIFSMY